MKRRKATTAAAALAGDWLAFGAFTGLRGALFAGTVALSRGHGTLPMLAVFSGLAWTVLTSMEFIFFLREVPRRWIERQRLGRRALSR